MNSKTKVSNNKTSFVKRILVDCGSSIKVIQVNDIKWIEVSGNYITLYVEDEKYLKRGTLSGFTKKIDPNKFYQIHRSTFVNVDFIDRFEELAYGDYEVVLLDGSILRMSRTYNCFLKQFAR